MGTATAYANITTIQAEYELKMKSAISGFETKKYTLETAEKLDKESEAILKILRNNANLKQLEIINKNISLWNTYTEISKNPCIRLLNQELGSIYQEIATSIVYSQSYTKAKTFQYIIPEIKFDFNNTYTDNLNYCIANAKNMKAKSQCFEKETDELNNNIIKHIESLSYKLKNTDYKNLLINQKSWENLVSHTQTHLFKLIDNIETEDKELKKYQILFLLFETRNSELHALLLLPNRDF